MSQRETAPLVKYTQPLAKLFLLSPPRPRTCGENIEQKLPSAKIHTQATAQTQALFMP